MKKLYCVNCGKYWEFGKPKISCLSEKKLVLSIISSEVSVKMKMKKHLKKK